MGCYFGVHTLFMNNTFVSNARLKLAKYQSNVKQKPDAKLYFLSSDTF